MKYHILHDFRTSTSFKENSSDKIIDYYKLKLLAKFDVILTSRPEGGTFNTVYNSS